MKSHWPITQQFKVGFYPSEESTQERIIMSAPFGNTIEILRFVSKESDAWAEISNVTIMSDTKEKLSAPPIDLKKSKSSPRIGAGEYKLVEPEVLVFKGGQDVPS
jgi:hypothetical protein